MLSGILAHIAFPKSKNAVKSSSNSLEIRPLELNKQE